MSAASDEYCLELIRFAKAYSEKIVFMGNEHREALLKICGLIKVCLKEKQQQEKRMKRKRKRSCWHRDTTGLIDPKDSVLFLSTEFDNGFSDDPLEYKKYLPLSEQSFNKILNYIKDDITKTDTLLRKATSPRDQLAITLRYLVTGERYKKLEGEINLSASFLVKCVPKVCQAIWNHMSDQYMKFPDTRAQWQAIADEFESIRQFPLCLGALYGAELKFNSLQIESDRDNRANSIILLALADAKSKFIAIDVIAKDRSGDDNEIWLQSSFKNMLDNAVESFPPDTILGEDRQLPYVMVADDNFSLQRHLLKPFDLDTMEDNEAIQIFNERLIRARQVVENAFDIMTSRFRIFKKPLILRNIENIKLISLACCVLHNFLMEEDEQYKCLPYDQTFKARTEFLDPTEVQSEDEAMRDRFVEYFNEEGYMQWMDEEFQFN